jgi:hypothetical protein
LVQLQNKYWNDKIKVKCIRNQELRDQKEQTLDNLITICYLNNAKRFLKDNGEY